MATTRLAKADVDGDIVDYQGRKLATRDRSTHLGTQTSSTISDLFEVVQDLVNAMIVAGTNVTKVYDDANGTLTISASGGSSNLDVEGVQDIVGGMLQAANGISVVYNDVGNLETISISNVTIAQVTNLQTTLNLKADLVSGKVAPAQLPSADQLTNFNAAVETYLATTNTPWEIYAASNGTGAYPARPATNRPVYFYGLNQPASDGSLSGGGGMVPNKDQWFQWQGQ